ncbi:60S ribosomal protein L7/L12 [Russula ochroleuca]|uniref:60S ribosomal protein L7/L12 n=1 Tax=Russula ochroleuca TaxID=152965 RepID=A0A9P5N3E8_9AGAM|nr:60S ribosomal protein L7/L12 [Russula ochroleuca]
MQSRLPLTLRATTRYQCVSARRTLTCMRVRALATATAEATTSTSPPPLPSPPASTSTTSTTSTTAPSPSDPALHRIVDDISTLTLLQAADLVTLLKTRLNIQEIALPAAGAAIPAAAGAAADEAAAGEEVAAKPKEKTIFNVRLESFDAGAKPKVIKEVKALVPNLTLIEAKKFVESLPKVLKESIPKEDAEKIKMAFEAHGAVVVLD